LISISIPSNQPTNTPPPPLPHHRPPISPTSPTSYHLQPPPNAAQRVESCLLLWQSIYGFVLQLASLEEPHETLFVHCSATRVVLCSAAYCNISLPRLHSKLHQPQRDCKSLGKSSTKVTGTAASHRIAYWNSRKVRLARRSAQALRVAHSRT